MNLSLINCGLVALSLGGNVFIVNRNRFGFALWSIANVGWIAVDAAAGLQEQAAMFGVYLVMSVWGWFAWGKNDRRAERADRVFGSRGNAQNSEA